MGRCTDCGRFYLLATGRPVHRAVVASGPVIQDEIPDGKCRDCRRPGEEVTLVFDGGQDLYDQGIEIND